MHFAGQAGRHKADVYVAGCNDAALTVIEWTLRIPLHMLTDATNKGIFSNAYDRYASFPMAAMRPSMQRHTYVYMVGCNAPTLTFIERML